MNATSPYLNQEPRSEATARRDRHISNLNRLATRLDRDAPGNIHASADQRRNRFGYQLADEASAIRWALQQIEQVTYESRMQAAVVSPLRAAE